MADIRISSKEVEQIYATLNTIGALGSSPAEGYLRAAYSKEESAAMSFVASLAKQTGAIGNYDAIGNFVP